MASFTLAPDTTITLETRAKGMLAALAHDLSIIAEPVLSTVVEGDAVVATLRFAPARLRVDGVRKNGAVDRGVLSQNDRRDIETKMRAEVLRGTDVTVEARVPLADVAASGESRANLRAKVTIAGRTRELDVGATVARTDDRVTVRTNVGVSMESFGLAPVKGPLNAFRVDDRVEIRASLVLTASDAA